MGLKGMLIGEGDRYRYGPMCMPTVPWKKAGTKLNFYSKGTCVLSCLVLASHSTLHEMFVPRDFMSFHFVDVDGTVDDVKYIY